MMNFDDAAQRLARDQQKIRGRKPVVVSQKAKQQAEFQRKQRAQMQAERERQRRVTDYQTQYLKGCERALHVKSLGASLLQPTSIYGTGDKISLPPSVLETLTAELGNSASTGNPWTFRIGIQNPDYQFPASPLIQTLKPPSELTDDHDDMMDSDDDDNDDRLPYLDEMAHKYIAYTHCTVVEFTQDEGHVGIPQHIATALLDPKNRLPAFCTKDIPVTRTVDPAKSGATETEEDTNMEVMEDPSSATPGHVAYGAFDIPNVPLEISLVKLPKGKGCTLVPTKEAIRRGFYGLKDVKLVLEQSLIRTRATLSKGDVVSTWHRGVQFDLIVTQVLPSAFGAVTCINTDIEVDIGETTTETDQLNTGHSSSGAKGYTLGTGQTLGSAPTPAASSSTSPMTPPTATLLPEPPVDQTENVVSVQIRFSGGTGRRRFDVSKATVRDLLDFAASLLQQQEDNFRLVTRFPRRVLEAASAASKLVEVGIHPGQELFLVEMI